jgi:asparagine synthetase B (glutamine-hydrolysing)
MIVYLNAQTGIVECKGLERINENLECWVSGYLFYNNEFITSDNFSPWIERFYQGQISNWQIQKLNGAFKIVLIDRNQKKIICISDRFGTNPLYYHVSDALLHLSDDPFSVSRIAGVKIINHVSIVEILQTGFITGNKTLIENVEEIESGVITVFSWAERLVKKEDTRYWRLTFLPDHKKSEQDWENEAADLFRTVFKRYNDACNYNRWSTCFTLSGGIDSRLLFGLCGSKMQKATAISYGKHDEPDVMVAKKVAESLNKNFIHFEIDPALFFSDAVLKNLAYNVGFTSRLTVGTGIKTFALKYPQMKFDALFSGHSFDLTAGSWIMPDTITIKNDRQAKATLVNRHYNSIPMDILKKILKINCVSPFEFIQKTYSCEDGDYGGALERWNYENRQRRLILREMLLYRQLGRWFLPFYDNDLFDFWTTVPLHLRLNQKLYINCLINNVFTKDLKSLGEIPLERGPLVNLSNSSMKDRFLLRIADSDTLLPYWNVISGTYKLKKRLSRFKKYSWGPDAIEGWWSTDTELKKRILSTISNSAYLADCLNIGALIKILNKSSVPNMLLRTGLPSILAIHYVGECLEDNNQNENNSIK